MREKYIEERFHRWFVFGKNSETGAVCVSDVDSDTICSCDAEEDANIIIADRDKLIDAMVEFYCKYPEIFYKET